MWLRCAVGRDENITVGFSTDLNRNMVSSRRHNAATELFRKPKEIIKTKFIPKAIHGYVSNT